MATREIINRRIGVDGLDVACDAEEDRSFDLKEDKKTTYEQGRGRHYRKTIYTYAPTSSRREYIDPPLTIEEGLSIEYQRGVIKHYWVEAGRGRYYRKAKIQFDNTAANTSRDVREQRVESSDNPADYVDVERVKEFRLNGGRGLVAQVKKVHRRHEEDEIDAMEGPCKIESEE